MQIKFLSNQQGYTLLELLVGLGLGSILIVFLARHFDLSFRFNKQVGDRYDLLQMSHDIERKIDCSRLPATCTAGKSIQVFQKDGAVMIGADRSSKVKGWNLAAECSTQNQILIRVAQIGPNGAFIKDPISLQPLDWQDKKGILIGAGLICPSGSLAPNPGGIIEPKVISGQPCFIPSKFLACTPPDPPACDNGFVSTGMTLDSFGGEANGNITTPIYGKRWIRYCSRKT